MCIFKMARRLAAIAVVTTLVSSCGGSGGGDDDDDGGPTRYTVTATAGAGGSVDPASVAVDAGQTTQITATPDTNYVLDDITGTCSGLRNGNVYTTGPINADCTANFLFVLATPQTPATLSLGGEQQQFVFTWSDVADADFYRLLENPDGASGYSQLGGDIASGVQTYSHPVTLYRRINASYILQSCNSAGCSDDAALFATDDLVSPIVYVKASNSSGAGDGDVFGSRVSLSADGTTLAVGAPEEDSNAQTINGDQNNDLAQNSGAVYVFVRNAGSWSQQAYIKASDAAAVANFGQSLSIRDNGNLLAVGAPFADTGGVVYLFERNAGTWSELQRLPHPSPDAADRFGASISLAGDGATLAVGVPGDDSSGAGINPPNNNDGINTGAVYLFQEGTPWVPAHYIKSASPDDGDNFGGSVSLDHNGTTLAVGASFEDGATLDESNNDLENSGAAYVFQFDGTWSQQIYLKASNRGGNARFGETLDLDAAGDTLAIGAPLDNSVASQSGAVYIFQQGGPNPLIGFWLEYGSVFKAGNAGFGDGYGTRVDLSADGETLAIGASFEGSASVGVAASPATDDTSPPSGAVYLYAFDTSSWAPLAYVKARHHDDNGAAFGGSVALSADGSALAVGAPGEGGTTTGIDSTPELSGNNYGAVFIY